MGLKERLNMRLHIQSIQRKQCASKGHWKRSCPKYLKDLKDEKVKNGSHSGMFMIELQNTTTSDSWVLDTGCGTHICTVLQGLKENVCGPFRSATKDGKRYYVTFTNDFSRCGYVYLIKHKSDTFEVFKRYQNEAENQLDRKIKGCEVTLDEKLRTNYKPDLNYPEESFGYLFYKPKDNVVFVARRGVFLEREMISKKDSGKVVTPIKPDDISLPICGTSGRVSKPPQF
uniref:Retrotransposon protein, putative, Ty1-copia subclass n=1 Tax=Tanacetum cinerariifolium TaxID=118510 RepID=A0A699JD02_TANCI|nr:retrotransposon protein, putative, Ty1-copia subclass [Tanacetum cinerariifolium]